MLADHLTVSYAPSLSTLIRLRARPVSSAPRTFVAFGDPVISQPGPAAADRPGEEGRAGLGGTTALTGDDPAALLLPAGRQLSPLPGTRAEAQAIASLFGADGRIVRRPG